MNEYEYENEIYEPDKKQDLVMFIVNFIQEYPFMTGLTVLGACLGAMIDKRIKENKEME